jgi:CDP-paratose 2-epimerase
MPKVLVSGAGGLIGSQAVRFFAGKGYETVGIDNDMRKYFFGEESSTAWNVQRLRDDLGTRYIHENVDIRDFEIVSRIMAAHRPDVVIHTAAQPSHDWAAREPLTDFGVNANGTLHMLESTRLHAPQAVFIFTSTNKVYGDTPNALPLIETETRFELPGDHACFRGIDECMSIDQSKHSLFGASKVAADVLVQEYGRYFGMKTAVFRGGCLTGPDHSGTQLHGFLAYLIKCIATGRDYTIFGYKGKQVRDNIHSHDLVSMFWEFVQAPRCGEVYNAGGGRFSNCSMLEAIAMAEKKLSKKAKTQYAQGNRIGDHIWYISDLTKFKSHYPNWNQEYSIEMIIEEICTKGHF